MKMADMKVRSNTLFSLGLAAGLAVLTFWLERTVHSPEGGASSARARVPEFVVDRVTATAMDKGGRAESRLTAQRMLYYPDEEVTEVEEPRLTQFPEKGPPVRVSAERGTVEIRTHTRGGAQPTVELVRPTVYGQTKARRSVAVPSSRSSCAP